VTARTTKALAAFVGLALAAVACSSGGDDDGAGSATTATTARPDGYVSEVYADDANWLCRPGVEGVCSGADLTATEIARDLATTEVPFEPAPDPAVDCFYVYPTVRADGAEPNATDAADREPEAAVTRDEAARFGAACRVFAPWYPQSIAPPGSLPSPESEQLAYDAVRDAFLHYLDQDNGGRPFALIGHGQGADLLSRVVQDEIDQVPERAARLLSAQLVGSTRVFVPGGAPVGGTFQNLPLCGDRNQVGCVIAYNAFQLGVPPPTGGGPLYAAIPEGMVAACTSPAGLDGSKGQFRGAYFPSTDPGLPPVATPYALYREYYRGECATRSGAAYLAIDTVTDPNDVRPLGPVEGSPGQEIGLGLFDVELELALGDLIDLVDTQARALGG
jgi:hypothetical protein